MRSVDVIVLGGGPAGATATRMLALWGHRVLLLTRPPRTPPLAESLTPSCSKLLDGIGVLDAINRAHFVRSTGHTVQWGNDERRVESFANGERGWQVLSSALDRVLMREARDAGATVHRLANVRRVDRSPDGEWHVSYEQREREKQIASPWVIDCTGRSGLMSRHNSGRTVVGPKTMALVSVWERRPHWRLADDSHTYVESYTGGWAWSVPMSRIRRQVTVMVDPSRTDIASGARLASTYRNELARTGMLRTMTAPARMIGVPWARDASSYSYNAPPQEGLLIAGDAASFVDPLSSFGVKKAMTSAWLAAVVVHTARTDPSRASAAMAFFSARERAMVAALTRQLRTLSDEAANAHPTGFWSDRTEADELSRVSDPDIAALRMDPRVITAFEQIRSAPQIRFMAGKDVRRVDLPVVEGHLIEMRSHWITAAFPDGIRYLRHVNVVVLAELAPTHAQVPDLYAAYCRRAGEVPLTDFLGALAVLVGTAILQIS